MRRAACSGIDDTEHSQDDHRRERERHRRRGARRLHDDGWSLALLDHADDALKRLASDINALPMLVDASDPRALGNALEQAIDRLGGVEAVWSNVSVQVNGTVLDSSLADFDRCIALNLRSHYVRAQTAIPHLIARGEGSLIITASNAGLLTEEAMVAYATTKAAAIALVRNLARDFASQKVRVNALCPGDVDTPFNAPVWQNFGGREHFIAQISESVPMGRMLDPDDVAEQVRFLLSESASLMTGQALVVDGGELIS